MVHFLVFGCLFCIYCDIDFQPCQNQNDVNPTSFYFMEQPVLIQMYSRFVVAKI